MCATVLKKSDYAFCVAYISSTLTKAQAVESYLTSWIIRLTYLPLTIAADDLGMQGTRAAMVLI